MAPIAAALFSTLWTSIFYGFEAMPNLYVAIGAVASVGYFLRIRHEPQRPVHLVWLTFWLAFTALMRPYDSLYLVAALLVGAATMRGVSLRRRGMVSAVLIAAVAVGWSEWIVEAFVSYGGSGAAPAGRERREHCRTAHGARAGGAGTGRAHVVPPVYSASRVARDGLVVRGTSASRSRHRRRGQPPTSSPRSAANVRRSGAARRIHGHDQLRGTALLAAGIRAREHPSRAGSRLGRRLPHPLVVAHALVDSRGRDACCSARQPASDT